MGAIMRLLAAPAREGAATGGMVTVGIARCLSDGSRSGDAELVDVVRGKPAGVVGHTGGRVSFGEKEQTEEARRTPSAATATGSLS